MHRIDPGRYPADWVAALENQPVVLAAGAADNQLQRSSRHYLDYALAGIGRSPGGRVYLTLDPELQRIANEVVEQGLLDLDRRSGPLARRRTQAALIVTRPSTGDVLAMVGGRAYDESQFNRALNAERQLGSIMKPFDYLAAFERAADEGRRDITAETVVVDEPTEFRFPGLRPWRPANYGHHYAGAVTWRRALAESRNVAAVKVARWGGIDRVAALWHLASGQRLPPLYPSMTLGAIQATPAEVARAYAMFATGGVVRPLRTTVDFVAAATSRGSAAEIRVARQESSEAVREMMRAVLDEGTARAARTAGFTIDAAGKTGTTDDLRDAWFAGFSGDLLAVVWVGHDGGQPLGLTGAQAALPIWTAFMKRAFRIS
jgi:penicillin-binding protein 1B